MSIYLVVFLIAFLISLGLVATQDIHGHFSMDTSSGVQKIHTHATPRIGGVAIVLGLVAAWLLAEPALQALLNTILLAGLPAFTFGPLEDVTKKISVLTRLLATMFSGVVAWYLTGVAMQDTGLVPLDWLLQFTPLAVLFTAFAVGGVANAINIIDGFNGLATGAVAIMLSAMGLIALNLGDTPLATLCFVLTACALGFGAVNWPMGKLFLGDGGAYLLGFCLAWVAVLLPMRHPEVNAWATVLICAYPVLEVAFSVHRRHSRVGHHPGQPDKVHLHHLIHRRVVRQLFPLMSAPLQNGMTSMFCWIFVALPGLWSVMYAENTPMLAFALAALVVGYAAVYSRLSQFRWCFGPATLQPIPSPTQP